MTVLSPYNVCQLAKSVKFNIWWHKPHPRVPIKYLPFCSIIYFIFQGCTWVEKVQNIFVECTIKCSNALSICVNCNKSLEALTVKPSISLVTVFNNICFLWMMHQIIHHVFISGGRKVMPHNAVPWGTVWCIISHTLSICTTWFWVKTKSTPQNYLISEILLNMMIIVTVRI